MHLLYWKGDLASSHQEHKTFNLSSGCSSVFIHTHNKIIGNLVRAKYCSLLFPHTRESLLYKFCLSLLDCPKLFSFSGTQPREGVITAKKTSYDSKTPFLLTIKYMGEEDNLPIGRNSASLETSLSATWGLNPGGHCIVDRKQR